MSWIITGTQKAGDPHWSNVSLLLHGDGINGSTTIIDNSPSPKTVTAFGNAQISTAQSKFGGASIAFDGSGDYAATPDSADFDIGSGNYTAECWFRPTLPPGLVFGLYRRALLTNYVNPTSGFTLYVTGTATSFTRVRLQDGDTEVLDAAANSTIDAWNHIAFVKSGSTCTIYLNGVAAGSATRGTFFSAISSQLRIGRVVSSVSAWDFGGFVDEVRITKGVARYTANFTPSTAPFPDPVP